METSLLNAPPASLGFGRPASTSNTKSKRKRKQPDPPPPSQDATTAVSQEQLEELAQNEIASGTHQLETLLCTSIDRNFDKFEIYVMRNILCVQPEDRDWMRLGHYEGLNFDNLPASVLAAKTNPPEGDAMDLDSTQDHPDTPTLDSVNRLRRRLQASQKLNTMLVAEHARNATLLTELRAIAGRTQQGAKTAAAAADAPPLSFLHDKGDLAQADATTPLTTTTAFALSQLQALRALGASLGTVMPDLGAQVEGPSGTRTWRKERVEYVESAARRHLESVRGLELGANGEVRDGEWQGEGRRVGSGEVGALESVVEMLGAAARDHGDEDVEDEEMAQGAG